MVEVQQITCPEVLKDCPQCVAEYQAMRAKRGEHTCSQLCELWGPAKAKSKEFHRLSHAPRRCDRCNAVLDDRLGNVFEVQAFCRAGYCVEFRCPECAKPGMGWGPVGCPVCSPYRRPSLARSREVTRIKRKGMRRWR